MGTCRHIYIYIESEREGRAYTITTEEFDGTELFPIGVISALAVVKCNGRGVDGLLTGGPEGVRSGIVRVFYNRDK